jgi:hypothetical protein
MGKRRRRGRRNAAAPGNDGEGGDTNAMITEDFLGDALVFGEEQSGGPATGERDADEFEERDDVLIEPAVVAELIGEIEHNIRLEPVDLVAEDLGIVEDCLMLDHPAKGLHGLEHIGFGRPIRGGQLSAQVLVGRGRLRGVEKGEDIDFLFHEAIRIIWSV